MLYSVFLATALAYTASAAVANVCFEQPYVSMQGFKDYEPANAYCAPHFPAQVVTKQLPNRCLTTTSTVVVGTSTVTATSSEACPTLQRRDSGDEREKERHRRICERWHRMKKRHDEQEKLYKEQSHHSPEEIQHYREEEHKWHERVKLHRKQHPHCHGYPKASLPESIYPVPESLYPVPTEQAKAKRDTGLSPAGVVKRDAMATKSSLWKQYTADLADCGYGCIQTACSCVAATKVIVKTPVPTCTQTSTKSTLVHVTTTVVVSPAACEHEDLRKRQ